MCYSKTTGYIRPDGSATKYPYWSYSDDEVRQPYLCFKDTECVFYRPILSWWHHQMEIFSVLLALCAGNSQVTGEFPAQRPVTGSFDVFFDLRLNKRWSKQSWGWWYETPLCSLWRHSNDGFNTLWSLTIARLVEYVICLDIVKSVMKGLPLAIISIVTPCKVCHIWSVEYDSWNVRVLFDIFIYKWFIFLGD